MLTSPRDARIAACALLVLGGAAVANVVFMQTSPRERRLTQVPVGLAAPVPESQRAAEARRTGGGPVTLSLASLMDDGPAPAQAQPQPTVAAAPSPPPAVASAPTGSAPDGTLSIDQIIGRMHQAPVQTSAPGNQQELVRQVQGELAARGYAPGPVDGDAGLLTRAAILAFEHDHGLAATAEPTEAVLAALRTRTSARRTAEGANWRSPSQTATALVRTVQQHLIAAGHLAGAPNGRLDGRTVAAIRSFETASDMIATGRISAPLVARLQRPGTARARLAAGR